MMTKEMVMELLAKAEADLMVDEWDDEISVTVDDFVGFDEDWSEVMRDLENAELVDEIYETLKKEAVSVDDDFYVNFHFEGFSVCWGYGSFDI